MPGTVVFIIAITEMVPDAFSTPFFTPFPRLFHARCDPRRCVRTSALVEESETIVIGNAHPAFSKLLPHIPPDKTIIDLVRIAHHGCRAPSNYQGIGW